MAKNFRVCRKERSKTALNLQLFGDFDASSACELINVINTGVGKTQKIAIDTSGLKTVSPFGLNLFIPQMASLSNLQVNIEVTGRFSEVFCEE